MFYRNKVFIIFSLILALLGYSAQIYAISPEEMGARISEILYKYQAEHPDELLKIELPLEGNPRVETWWSHTRAAVRFYHGEAHRNLKAMFGLSPQPAHPNPEEIQRVKGMLNSPKPVRVVNTLFPFKIEILPAQE